MGSSFPNSDHNSLQPSFTKNLLLLWIIQQLNALFNCQFGDYWSKSKCCCLLVFQLHCLSLLPTPRMCIITTGHDLPFALPVGVDTLHSGSCCRRSPGLRVLRSPEAFLTHCRLCTVSGELCSHLCWDLWWLLRAWTTADWSKLNWEHFLWFHCANHSK